LPSSQGRLPVPSPLRTVLDTFASHGSSLTKAMKPVPRFALSSGIPFKQTLPFRANADGSLGEIVLDEQSSL
jgi:hypothetical protein